MALQVIEGAAGIGTSGRAEEFITRHVAVAGVSWPIQVTHQPSCSPRLGGRSGACASAQAPLDQIAPLYRAKRLGQTKAHRSAVAARRTDHFKS